MKNLHYILIVLFLVFDISVSKAQSLKERLTDYAANYIRTDSYNSKTTYKGYVIDSISNTLIVTFDGGFSEQHFTEDVVRKVYNDVKSLIPDDMKGMNLSIVTENHPIEFLVPNSLRVGHRDNTRQLKYTYTGNPWVKNISRPYTATRGLENCHISLWQSHGRYWRFDKDDWYWQRPRLFCTTEDLLSQTFVIPYIIPMLQNAGAIVFTPRERDYQVNEVIVDNDQPNANGVYAETTKYEHTSLRWSTAEEPAFKDTKSIYNVCDTPFVSGTARYTSVVSGNGDVAIAQWVPNIPQSGKYAVYVTYPSYPNSAKDAHYVVFHKGGMTEFNVNQSIGGGTWVYLGTFEFDKGKFDYGKVMLTNISKSSGIVCADAVKFGGGMGNVIPAHVTVETEMVDTVEIKHYSYEPTGFVSGLPRWAEAAKYSAFWYGMPYRLHSGGFDNNEYNNDIRCRSLMVNELSGNSTYNPDNEGRGIPFELNLAFHTDAGFDKEDGFIGSLGIYMTDSNEGLTASGMDRYVSRDLASSILTNLSKDLKKYNWKVRNLWNRDYGEARSPLSPAIILEMLSHQNFADMQKAYDPKFKFDFCRSVYKSIVKFVAAVHNRHYVIQPLPVKEFAVDVDANRSAAILSWQSTNDPLENTADADEYIVYTRQGSNGFDNGRIVKGTSTTINIEKGQIYSFKVAALNKGGESFPSEILSAYVAPNSKGKILIVNAFVRLEGPSSVNNEKEQGFRLDIDPGVPYGTFTGFCGEQKGFDKRKAGSEAKDGLGASGMELEGKIFMGNTFDYPYIHGTGIKAHGEYSFCSVSEEAFKKHKNLKDYKIIDVIFGSQKYFDQSTIYLLQTYRSQGGRILVSGSNISNNRISDLAIDKVNGCGTEFNIYREMNAESFALPTISIVDGSETILSQPLSAFPMLAYSNNTSAGTAYDGADFKSILVGFPLESIKQQDKINNIMTSFINFLAK